MTGVEQNWFLIMPCTSIYSIVTWSNPEVSRMFQSNLEYTWISYTNIYIYLSCYNAGLMVWIQPMFHKVMGSSPFGAIPCSIMTFGILWASCCIYWTYHWQWKVAFVGSYFLWSSSRLVGLFSTKPTSGNLIVGAPISCQIYQWRGATKIREELFWLKMESPLDFVECERNFKNLWTMWIHLRGDTDDEWFKMERFKMGLDTYFC